jgi:hypothetical protein
LTSFQATTQATTETKESGSRDRRRLGLIVDQPVQAHLEHQNGASHVRRVDVRGTNKIT